MKKMNETDLSYDQILGVKSNHDDPEQPLALNSQSDDTGDPVSDFHVFAINNYIKKKMFISLDDNSDDIFNSYSTLFKQFLRVIRGGIDLSENSISIFEQIYDKLNATNTNISLFINSYAGYGKTEFLSVLYQFLFKRYKEGRLRKLPLYISLHLYNKYIYESTEDFHNQGKDKIATHCERILDYLQNNPELGVVLIIDGADEFRYPKTLLIDYVFSLFENRRYNLDIIGIRKYSDKYKKRYRRKYKPEHSPDIVLELGQIDISDTSRLKKVVESFSFLEKRMKNIRCNATSDHLNNFIHDEIKTYKLSKLDFFHLFLLSKGFQDRNFYLKAGKSIGRFYHLYLKRCNVDIDLAARIAFKVFNNPEDISNEEKNSKEWWKIQKHNSICDYLTALFVIETLKTDDIASNNVIFNIVYPLEINNYSKDIVNMTPDSNRKIFNSIKKLYGHVGLSAKTHFCYLLGRIEVDEDVIKEAKSFLEEKRKMLSKKVDEITFKKSYRKVEKREKLLLFLYRTICISLIKLGAKNVSSKFIVQLINSYYFDSLNRGFHLEYYGDIDFLPNEPHSLHHMDKLGSCEKSFAKLYEKLSKAIISRRPYPLFEVDLYTLCSLAQHRQAKGVLQKANKDKIRDLISRIRTDDINLCSELNSYLCLIDESLDNNGKFSPACHISTLYKLKEIYRQGWVIRDIKHPETVASHILGALLLAYFYLPEQLDQYESFSKSEVLRMILIHDLGEAYTGDIPTTQKTKKHLEIEKREMRRIDMLKTYKSFSKEMKINELFEDFASNSSINAKLARDFDKLDNLFQLYIYNTSIEGGISDFESFRDDLTGKIQTVIGQQIRKQIELLFS